jgi:hypothetical protein
MKQFLLAFLVAGSLVACQSSSANPAHGEEGHKCDKECMAQQGSKSGTESSETTALKDHECTDACKDGNHVYAHGEKGHTCTDACITKSVN